MTDTTTAFAASITADASCWALVIAALTAARALSNAALIPFLIASKNEQTFEPTQPKNPPPPDSCSPRLRSAAASRSPCWRACSASCAPWR